MLRAALILALLGALLALPAVAAGKPEVNKAPASTPELVFEPRDFPDRADPPLPDPLVFPIQMVLDDDGAEGVFGFSGGTARQFLWFNRLTIEKLVPQMPTVSSSRAPAEVRPERDFDDRIVL